MEHDIYTLALLRKAEKLLREPDPEIMAEADPFREACSKAEADEDKAAEKSEQMKASGDYQGFKRSRKVVRYYREYATKLRAIIRGIEARANGKSQDETVVFTKQKYKQILDDKYLNGVKAIQIIASEKETERIIHEN